MEYHHLDSLNKFVKTLLDDECIKDIINDLKNKIRESEEPFIWRTIDTELYHRYLPRDIKSVWLFALKKNTPSIAHYHPNSTQLTIVIEGEGKVKVADLTKELRSFNPFSPIKEKNWIIIDKNIPHEFFPRKKEMMVISFHTCVAEELMEIKCENGELRVYEKR